jgi:hypothetical protein
MIVPLTDVTLTAAIADLTARDQRLPREAVAGQIAAIDAIARRALGLWARPIWVSKNQHVSRYVWKS